MNDRPVFIDTNVLIYATDADSPKKRIALELLATRPVVSIQVINECANVLRKKFRLDYANLATILENYLKTVTLVPVTLASFQKPTREDVSDARHFCPRQLSTSNCWSRKFRRNGHLRTRRRNLG